MHVVSPYVAVGFTNGRAEQTHSHAWMRTFEFVDASNYLHLVKEQSHRQPDIAPLTPQEEAAWRALARAVLVVPRALDAEMLAAEGLNITEYNVLVNLSETPGHSLRMRELANFVSISVSGLTRVVQRLSRQGLVERIRAESDGRGQVAVITPAGMKRLQQAGPSHLAAVCRHVMDHLGDLDLVALADAFADMGSAEVGPRLRHRTTPSRG
jgi:DNA-binding MarR family transcriptional regulator